VLRVIKQTCSFNFLTASHECYRKLAFGFSPKPPSIPFIYPIFCGATARSGLGRLIVRVSTRVGTLIVATIYLQLIQNRYMFRNFTVLQCSHQHCVQSVASDVEVIGYL